MTGKLARVAVYERRVRAGLARVWENVHDWEHLPWLHAGNFSKIALLDRGAWGWKARIGLARDGREILLELVREGDDRYVSRTLEGPGAGTEIWTRLSPVDDAHTDIRVEFLVPDVAPGAADALGRGFTHLYARLWDEDEAMMRRRTALLATERVEPSQAALDLGPVDAVRARVPFAVDFGGRRFRIVEIGGELVAHATVCPHWLGPLDEADVVEGAVTCPWHGYRFDVATGRRCDAKSTMRLAPAPRVVADAATGRLRLAPPQTPGAGA